MGRKITIDSATLFNKGLEMIEARWLFDIEMARVGVLVHPQSIVHSMVEFVDGSMLAQISTPDMCLPIQYALTCPDRAPSERVQTNFAKLGTLTFEEPDTEHFRRIDLARRAGEIGGTLPAVLNAANEVAVEAFVDRRIKFPQISETVRRTHGHAQGRAHPTLEQILAADGWARRGCGNLNGGKQAYRCYTFRAGLVLHDSLLEHTILQWLPPSWLAFGASFSSTSLAIFGRRASWG